LVITNIQNRAGLAVNQGVVERSFVLNTRIPHLSGLPRLCRA
jgi:hypothetical protein